MLQILQIAASVTKPLALLGLVVAFACFAYIRWLKHAETQLQSLAPDERAKVADEYLTRYGIDGKDLAPADKLVLIQGEMKNRHRRSIAILYVAAGVLVLCFGLAVFAYISDSRPDTTPLVNELEERARVVLNTMNQKIATLRELEKEGIDTHAEIKTLSESIDRFTLLHKEYVDAIRDGDLRLSHERLGKLKEFLGDPKLLAALGTVFKPVYSISSRRDESGKVHKVKTRKWVRESTGEGEAVSREYLAPPANSQGKY